MNVMQNNYKHEKIHISMDDILQNPAPLYQATKVVSSLKEVTFFSQTTGCSGALLGFHSYQMLLVKCKYQGRGKKCTIYHVTGLRFILQV